MSSSLTTKFDLVKEHGDELADQLVSLGGNYDILDAKLPGKKDRAAHTVDDPGSPFDEQRPIIRFYALGNIWMEVTGSTVLAFTNCRVGDWIEVGISGLWENNAQEGFLCVCTTELSGFDRIPINSFGAPVVLGASTGQGVPSWRGDIGAFTPIQGSVLYQLVADDIDVGTCLVSFFMRSVDKGIYSWSTIPLIYWAQNLGQ